MDGGERVVSDRGRARARSVRPPRSPGTRSLPSRVAGARARSPRIPPTLPTRAIAIEERAVEIALSVNLFELDLVLALDRDLDGRVDAARARGPARRRRRATCGARSACRRRDARCPWSCWRSASGGAATAGRWSETTLAFRSEHALRDIAIRCEPLTELGADHTTLARIDTRGGSREFVFRPGVTYRRGAGGARPGARVPEARHRAHLHRLRPHRLPARAPAHRAARR